MRLDVRFLFLCLWLLACLARGGGIVIPVAGQWVRIGDGPTRGVVIPVSQQTAGVGTMNYLALSNSTPGTLLTPAVLSLGTIPTNTNYGLIFSANSTNQFSVSSVAAPTFQTPIIISNVTYAGTEAHVIALTNNLNYSTVEWSLPTTTNLPVLSVSGFVMVPTLTNGPATYDLLVLASSIHAAPYSTENWTLQLSCGQTNYIGFEDANSGTGTSKSGWAPVPTNTWLYFTLSMNTTSAVETATVLNATNWATVTAYTNNMGLTNTFCDYWLFGNNEAGSQSGTVFYFSGLNWTNTPPPPPPPPYTYPTNALIAQYKFNGDLSDSSPNNNPGSEFGGSYGFVTGQDSIANHALAITNGAVTCNGVTNPVSAISVTAWVNTGQNGFIACTDDSAAWKAAVGWPNQGQGAVYTSGGTAAVQGTNSMFGGWHFYALTWNGSGTGDGYLRVYRDGVLDGTSTNAVFGTITTTTQPLKIASDTLGFASDLIVGWLDDVRVYGRALNPTEVTNIFTAGADGNINL